MPLCSERPSGDYVASLGKGGRQKLLRALARRLDRQRFTQGRIQHILHARVPILKFACAKTGAPPPRDQPCSCAALFWHEVGLVPSAKGACCKGLHAPALSREWHCCTGEVNSEM